MASPLPENLQIDQPGGGFIRSADSSAEADSDRVDSSPRQRAGVSKRSVRSEPQAIVSAIAPASGPAGRIPPPGTRS